MKLERIAEIEAAGPALETFFFRHEDEKPRDSLGRVHFSIVWFERNAKDGDPSPHVFRSKDGEALYARGQHFFAIPEAHEKRCLDYEYRAVANRGLQRMSMKVVWLGRRP